MAYVGSEEVHFYAVEEVRGKIIIYEPMERWCEGGQKEKERIWEERVYLIQNVLEVGSISQECGAIFSAVKPKLCRCISFLTRTKPYWIIESIKSS